MKPFSAIIISLLIGVTVASSTLWQMKVGVISGVAYLLWFGWLYGRRTFKRESAAIQTLIGLLIITVLIIIIGSIVYYAFNLTALAAGGVLAVIALGGLAINWQWLTTLQVTTWHSLAVEYGALIHRLSGSAWRRQRYHLWRRSGLIAGFLILWLIAWQTVLAAATTAPIRSLWETLPTSFLAVYFALTVVIIIIHFTETNRTTNLFISRLYIFLSLGLAVFLYQIGFGFDTFIHHATEQAIWQNGYILPKTPYYIGLYSLVVILARLSQLSVSAIDTFIIPVFFATFVPAALFLTYRRLPNWSEKKYFWLVMALLLLPYQTLIATTPHALAFVIAMIAVITSQLLVERAVNPRFAWLLVGLAMAATVIHPLVGIPLAMFVALIIGWVVTARHRPMIMTLLTIAAVVALPVVFGIGARFWPAVIAPLTLDNATWQFFTTHILPTWPDFTIGQNIFVSLAHLWEQLRWWLLGASASYGIWLYRRSSTPYVLACLVVGVDYLMIKIFLPFDSVIAYERFVFANRLVPLAFLFALPLCLIAWQHLADVIRRRPWLLRWFFTGVIAGAVTASLYLAYPHHDVFTISRLYSVSETDLATVMMIEEKSHGPYVVLANQMVSAAAVRVVGFNRLYDIDGTTQYFYPIPTASPLYNYYLAMIKNPLRSNITELFSRVAVDEVYFVVNNYWDDAATIVAQSKTIADDAWPINDGQNWVFVFRRSAGR